ncbi:MAG: uroporphyrinogen decarboxylase family protein [Bacteroidales bacterium]|nr:uroporphyrinogen decarboxylase family protein [Bacteroidales bacterium]
MTSKERLLLTLNHQEPDRVCVDFGATSVTGIHVSIISKLWQRTFGQHDYRVKIIEPYQMLGEIDPGLRDALGIDVIGTPARKSLLGTDEDGTWKPFRLFDGTEVMIHHNLNFTVDREKGDLLAYPEGDMSVGPSARMPKDGLFFDTIIRQDPIDEDNLNVADNTEEFTLFTQEDINYYRNRKKHIDRNPDYGSLLSVPGTAFGDIALVPAPFLKHPKGIRDIQEWYMSPLMRRDYVYSIFEKQCEIALQNLDTLIAIMGDSVHVAMVSGTDFGTQTGTLISPDTYRDLYKPFYQEVNNRIHQKSNWKTFIHSCGAIRDLIPDFIESGFDILNPVQISAKGMDARELKNEFGKEIVFWGGGVDTQKTLPYGTPDDVYREVRERIEIFSPGGGFVFNTIHNIQGNVPVENVEAMFKAIRDSH